MKRIGMGLICSVFVVMIAGVAWGAVTEGSTNTSLGNGAGAMMQVGGTFATGTQNATFIGLFAGALNKNTGLNNSFVGSCAGANNTEGSGNSFFGSYAGDTSTLGSNNSFFGWNAGMDNTVGELNTFLGSNAGYKNIGGTYQGSYNTYVGAYSGHNGTIGVNNTYIGHAAGRLATGYGNVFIGNGAGYTETYGSNKLYIDNCKTEDTSGTGGWCTQPLIYGDFDQRTIKIDGSLTMVTVATPSDERYKKEIHPLESSLEKVLHLQGVSYSWNKDKVKGAGFKDGRQIGLIAQEVEKILPELVQTDEQGYKTLSYDKIVPVLIEAVKEQQKEIKEQQAMINNQQKTFSKAMSDKDAEIDLLKKAMLEITGRLAAVESSAKTVAVK